jgi:hypothetical protein
MFITESSSSPNPNPSIFSESSQSKPNSFELITDFSTIKQVHPNSTQTSINSRRPSTNPSSLQTLIGSRRIQKPEVRKEKNTKARSINRSRTRKHHFTRFEESLKFFLRFVSNIRIQLKVNSFPILLCSCASFCPNVFCRSRVIKL